MQSRPEECGKRVVRTESSSSLRRFIRFFPSVRRGERHDTVRRKAAPVGEVDAVSFGSLPNQRRPRGQSIGRNIVCPTARRSETMKQALDFRDESRALHALLQPLSDRDFALTTRFKAWSLDAIVAHLHFYNLMADLTLKDEAQFHEKMARVKALRAGGETMVSSADIMLDGLSGRCRRLARRIRNGSSRLSTVDPGADCRVDHR
jgi:hypothetical protein